MLKTIPPTTSCGCGYFKTKCAEIHYQMSDFSILCIFCGMSTANYSDFIDHFHNRHFEEFSRNMECNAEPVITTIYEDRTVLLSESKHHDPLEFGEKERGEDADPEVEMIKSVHLGNKSALVTAGMHANVLDSDDEYLICKVKVERSDLRATKPIKPHRARSQRQEEIQNTDLSMELMDVMSTKCMQPDMQAQSKAEDAAVSSDVSPTPTEAEEEVVNWSEPYKPNITIHEKRPYKPRNKPNICTYCGRTFRRRYQLDTHLNIHTGSKPHQCEICGRQFRAVTTLTRHLNTHEQRETYGCKYCDKSFTHRAALVSHELRHTQERRVPCDECNKFFYTANQMDTHRRKVHNKSDDKTLPFACDLCPKRYRSASMLSTHKFKKHYKTAKFSCQQCEKKFINEQKLEAHKLIHVDGLTSNIDI